MNKHILLKDIKIKIIGDSIAAGAGSSMSHNTEELIFEEEGTKFFRRVAPNSWWGLLEQYLRNNRHHRIGKHGANLILFLGREDIDDAINGFGRAARM